MQTIDAQPGKKRKTIMILANNSDGLYGFRGDLIRCLTETYDVVACSPNNGLTDKLEELGCRFIEVPVDRRGINPVKDLMLYRTFKKKIQAEKPDFVITYTIKPNVYGGYACRRCKVPYAVNVTGLGTAFQGNGLLSRLVTVMNRVGCKGARVVFFENEGNRDIFVEKGIIPASVTHVLHGAGVNLERFAFAAYPAPSETTRFLFTGRVMREKGVDELFAAMRRLRAEGFKCELDILGNYEENYKDTLGACAAEGWLHYQGYQTDVRPFIAAANCFVLPSYHEGMANVNLECAAMGRPLITTRIHGCMEAVIEGQSGLLCEKGNADSLYEAMKAFMSLSHEERAAMGRAGRAHMEAVFDKRLVVADTIRAMQLPSASSEPEN